MGVNITKTGCGDLEESPVGDQLSAYIKAGNVLTGQLKEDSISRGGQLRPTKFQLGPRRYSNIFNNSGLI